MRKMSSCHVGIALIFVIAFSGVISVASMGYARALLLSPRSISPRAKNTYLYGINNSGGTNRGIL